MSKHDVAIQRQLEGQHPIDAMLGRVYNRLGGEEFIVEWASENPGAFIRLFAARVPSLTPMNHVQGDIHLHVHHTLAPTDLDKPLEGALEEPARLEEDVVSDDDG